MGRFVIVAYKPKLGQDRALLAVVRKHVAVLGSQQLVSDRAPYVMRAADGTLVEVFEWRSAAAIDAAHSNPAVQALWGEFGAVCDYLLLSTLAEAQQMFAEFEPVDLSADAE